MIDVKKLLKRSGKRKSALSIAKKRNKCVAVERRKFIELSLARAHAYIVANKMQL